MADINWACHGYYSSEGGTLFKMPDYIYISVIRTGSTSTRVPWGEGGGGGGLLTGERISGMEGNGAD